MKKLIIFLLTLLTVSSCKDTSKDLAQAPNNQQIGRYGIDQIKLGTPQEAVFKKLDSSIKDQLICTEKKVALEKIRRVFISKECTLPKAHKPIQLWKQQLAKFESHFLDNKLICLDIIFKTPESDKALYEKHAKHVLSLFGKPSVIDLGYVRWNKNNDQVMLQRNEQGSLTQLTIQNKQTWDHLTKTDGNRR